MPDVMVNSTPLIALCNIGRLDLLEKLYGRIIIPQAVYDEVTEKEDAACRQIRQRPRWIEIAQVSDQSQKQMYRARLHDGEVEVMILAQGSPATALVIIDDNAAKKTAKFLGLHVTGTLGVLLKAKRMGLVEHVAPIIDELCENGFYVDDAVKAMALSQAGETHNKHGWETGAR